MAEDRPHEGGRPNPFVRLGAGWIGHKRLVLQTAVLAMSFAAALWLGYEFYRLLWQPTHIGSREIKRGAIDLKIRHQEVHLWFDGIPLYEVKPTTPYPPATNVLLWGFVGWLELAPAVWLWAATTVVMLVWLIYLVVRESLADTPLEKIFIALLPLSMYATGATVGNGQLMIHILPPLIAGLCLLSYGSRGWPRDLLAASLVLFPLLKPTVAVPFFWLALFVPGRIRPALLVCIGYVALTLFAASFQDAGAVELFARWLKKAENTSVWGSRLWSSWDLHVLLGWLGLEKWVTQATLLVLGGLGLWVYVYRRIDLWILMGVTGLVARLWTYHGWYDDLLVLLPMIALFRWIKRRGGIDGYTFLAGALLGMTLLVTIAPGGKYLLPAPFDSIYVTVQNCVWIADLGFLLAVARHEKAHNE
jgi:hypothetical protein